MNIDSSSVATTIRDFPKHWRYFFELTKPKVVLLLVFTALVGMVLAVPGWLPLRQSFFGLPGIGLAASSAAALNHVLTALIISGEPSLTLQIP